jgi:ribulose-phosphate 3-epimerase
MLAALGKLERMSASLPDTVALEVDGGIHESYAPQVVGAGANLLITGSGVFGSADPAAAYRAIAPAQWVR